MGLCIAGFDADHLIGIIALLCITLVSLAIVVAVVITERRS